MWKFYRRLLWSAIIEFWGATDKGIAASAVVLFFVGLFNQKLAERVVTAWNGISPWWSLLPIGSLALYRIMRANYEAFVRLEEKVLRQSSRDTVQELMGRRLQDAKELSGRNLSDDAEILAFQRDFEYWVIKTEAELQGLGLNADAHLFATADSGFVRMEITKVPVASVPEALSQYVQDVRATCGSRLIRYQYALREILKKHSD